MMVVGGGISGLCAAVDLARLGVAVILVETSGSLGGHAARLSCKAAQRCVACGACVVEEKIRQASTDANIRVHLNTCVDKIDRHTRFEVSLNQGLKIQHIEVDAVLMASGFAPFHPVNKPYGYGRFENVMTTLELDRMLRRSGTVKRPSDARSPGTWPLSSVWEAETPAWVICGARKSAAARRFAWPDASRTANREWNPLFFISMFKISERIFKLIMPIRSSGFGWSALFRPTC